MKISIVVFFAFVFSLTINAQERNISGKITAFNTYELKAVKISAKKAKTETVTDEFGNFQIKTKSNDVIKIQADGFENQVLKLGDENILKINLIYITNNSAFKSAINANHISEKDLEYAVDNLMQENNDYSRYQSVFDLIQAKYPLAKVISNNGFNRIYLTSKGPNSLETASHALIVVDGMITENISTIQPTQVATIKVITGTDTSMYGTRGGNGVVEIELKH